MAKISHTSVSRAPVPASVESGSASPSTRSWGRFLQEQIHLPPLRLVNGMRHSIPGANYCHMHSHRGLEAVYHPTGQGVTRLEGGREIPFQEGCVVLYAPGEMHDQTMNCAGDDLCLQLLLPADAVPVAKGGLCLPRLADADVAAEFVALSRGHTRVGPIEQGILNMRATAAVLHVIQAALARDAVTRCSPAEAYVRRAENYIKRNFQTLASVEEVATHIGLSSNHLRHLFKELRGRPMVQWVTEVRMERAKSLLVNSRMPLKQVARHCGFNDEYYFSAVFRRHNHMAPGQYRNRH